MNQDKNILVINCGSSSIKFALFKQRELIKSDTINVVMNSSNKNNYSDVLEEIYNKVKDHKIEGIGHRVVHGGEYFSDSILIDDDVLKKIEKCSGLSPLHNPVNIEGIRFFQKKFKGLAHVAVFDTSFHQSMPEKAYKYALPSDYQYLRKYGFHGTSHRYVASVLDEVLFKSQQKGSYITLHIGNGVSLCSIDKGMSVDTTMGLTPLDGPMMGTRSGSIDPSIIPYLGKSVSEALTICNTKSGLLGVSGMSSDMRVLEKSKSKEAHLAIEMFCYQIAKYLLALLAPLKQIDAIIFTAGIGENAKEVRTKIINYLAVIGVKINEEKNSIGGSYHEISTSKSTIKVYIVRTDEEKMIAKDTFEVLEIEYE